VVLPPDLPRVQSLSRVLDRKSGTSSSVTNLGIRWAIIPVHCRQDLSIQRFATFADTPFPSE